MITVLPKTARVRGHVGLEKEYHHQICNSQDHLREAKSSASAATIFIAIHSRKLMGIDNRCVCKKPRCKCTIYYIYDGFLPRAAVCKRNVILTQQEASANPMSYFLHGLETGHISSASFRTNGKNVRTDPIKPQNKFIALEES